MEVIEGVRERFLWRYHSFVQAARIVLGLVSSGAFWGLDSLRFVPPAFTIGTIFLSIVSVLPSACVGLSAVVQRVAKRWPAFLLTIAGATVPALIAWWLPDRTRFIGDTLQRLGAVSAGTLSERFPQTMPLDAVLNQMGARTLAHAMNTSLLDANRLLGAGILFATGVAASVLARPHGAKGKRFVLVALTTTLSGMLFACVGSGRADSWMAFLSVTFIGLVLRDLERPSRWPVAEGVFVLALFVHRATLMMLPLLLLLLLRNVVGWGVSNAPRPAAGRRLGALGLAMVALSGVPRYWEVFTSFDAVHHLAPTGWTLDIVRAAVAPRQLLDVVNTLLLVVPAAPLLLVLLATGRRSTTRVTLLASILAVLPWLAAVLLAHPQQGLFRDFSVFAPFGAVCGFLLGRYLVREWGELWARRLAVGATLSLVTATLAPMALWATPTAGHARLVAFAADGVGQSAPHRADVWSFLALQYAQDGLPRAAFEVTVKAFALQPTPRRRAEYLFAGAKAGAYAEIAQVSAHAIRSRSAGILEWLTLTGASSMLGDSVTYHRGERVLLDLAKDPDQRVLMNNALRFCPELWPSLPRATRQTLTAPSGD